MTITEKWARGLSRHLTQRLSKWPTEVWKASQQPEESGNLEFKLQEPRERLSWGRPAWRGCGGSGRSCPTGRSISSSMSERLLILGLSDFCLLLDTFFLHIPNFYTECVLLRKLENNRRTWQGTQLKWKNRRPAESLPGRSMCLSGLSFTYHWVRCAGMWKDCRRPWLAAPRPPGRTKGRASDPGEQTHADPPLTCGPFTFSEPQFLFCKKKKKKTERNVILILIGPSSWADQTELRMGRVDTQT